MKGGLGRLPRMLIRYIAPTRSSVTNSAPSGITSTSSGRPHAVLSAWSQPSANTSYFDGAIAVQVHDGTRLAGMAGARAPIPRPVLGNEDLSPIPFREHVTRVEAHPERGHVRPERFAPAV